MGAVGVSLWLKLRVVSRTLGVRGMGRWWRGICAKYKASCWRVSGFKVGVQAVAALRLWRNIHLPLAWRMRDVEGKSD